MFDETHPANGSIMQDPAFARALVLCGQTPVKLPDGHLLLYRRLLGVPVAMLPRAVPPVNLPAQLNAIGLHRTPVILSPDTPCAVPGALALRRPRDRLLLDLCTDNETARGRLHPKWRNQLRQIEKRPVHVTYRNVAKESLQGVLTLEKQQSRSRGYTNWPIGLTAAFAKSAPKQTHLFTAEYRGQTVAHMLFLSYGKQASYHIGHITPMGKKLCAHNLLLWRGARYLASRGLETLELGHLLPRNAGLNRFKLRTGAQRIKTGGTWLYWRPFATTQIPASAP